MTPEPSDLSAALIGLIGTRGPHSRADAARALGVSPVRVTQATRGLLEAGVLVETGTVPSGGGRPAILLDLTSGRRCALGVKVTPNHLALARVDLAGDAGASVSIDLDMRAPDAVERVVDLIAAHVRDDRADLLGIGLALPGALDPRDAHVSSAILGWQRVPLADMLTRASGLPVLVDNDVNALAIAGRLYDGGLPDDMVVVTIGYGIGCALVQDGRVYRGARGAAGEFGHTLAERDGEPCECGLRGCLETLIGDNALARRAVALGVLPPGGTKDDLNAAARAGDRGALDLFAWAGRRLGESLASLVHVVDPEALVVSGEGVDVWEFWADGAGEALREHLPRGRRDLEVVVRAWDEGRWARGAASLVFASPFDRTGASSPGRRVRRMMREGV